MSDSAPPDSPAADAPDAKLAGALLETANSASQSVAVLHFTFMAVCAYLLLVVIGTTDMHLLLGRSVPLPVVNQEVPIVAFYALSPYLLTLLHFNLLLQFQLLSRKLYAFDAAAGPRGHDPGSLRDRLHVFPYSYLLAGDMTPLVRNLTAHVVAITLIALPVVTLFAMQIRFLGYQSAVVTTAQRVALWIDLILVIAMWPVIMDKRDRWLHWWHELFAQLRLGPVGWTAYALLLLGLMLVLFGGDYVCVRVGVLTMFAAMALALVRPLGERGPRALCARLLPTLLWALSAAVLLHFTPLFGHWAQSMPTQVFAIALVVLLGAPWIFFWRSGLPCGGVVLAGFCTLQLLLPQAVTTEGELMARWPGWLAVHLGHAPVEAGDTPGASTSPSCPAARAAEVEDLLRYRPPRIFDRAVARADWCRREGWSVLSCDVLEGMRRLDLREQALFAQPLDPATLTELRRDSWTTPAAWDSAQSRVQRAILKGRALRHARLEGALLVRADLRQADLTGACLTGAWLGGADLDGANLRGATLLGAHLRDIGLGRRTDIEVGDDDDAAGAGQPADRPPVERFAADGDRSPCAEPSFVSATSLRCAVLDYASIDLVALATARDNLHAGTNCMRAWFAQSPQLAPDPAAPRPPASPERKPAPAGSAAAAAPALPAAAALTCTATH
ncbi:pentapeptide repeat-containing protein [Derxia lacustris]|uniref:pentapeptide repeat-containing protein n=1 Tax=Derxia lacustris TaxID=764842 RepID=UPI000A16F797|nr:pentapeptide repeat-containing protein [Derxia lacustris]